MLKIPKFSKTELCFVKKISSDEEKKQISDTCSSWLDTNPNRFYGYYSMNYGKSEPRLGNTIFYIFRWKNTKDAPKSVVMLVDFMKQLGFIQVEEESRKIEQVLKLFS